MPWDEVMHKFGKGKLKSGGPDGSPVKNQKQAVAIMMSEKRKAAGGKKEYQSKKKAAPKAPAGPNPFSKMK